MTSRCAIFPVNFFLWQRRVDKLREEHERKEKFLNPISGVPSRPASEEIEELVEEKLREFIESDDFKEARRKLYRNTMSENGNQYESVIVESEKEIIEYSNRGWECEKIDGGKWLMRKEVSKA